jgi:hypothetical protein
MPFYLRVFFRVLSSWVHQGGTDKGTKHDAQVVDRKTSFPARVPLPGVGRPRLGSLDVKAEITVAGTVPISVGLKTVTQRPNQSARSQGR